MKVFGLVGPLGAGKTTAAELLVKKGFTRMSLTEELKKEVEKRGLALTRQVFLDVADELRREEGNYYFAQKASETLEKMSPSENANIVFDGIKNPGEIEFLKKKYKMILIGIAAPEKIRVERILERASELDKSATQELLKEQLKRDAGLNQEDYGNKINDCMKLVDININNNGTIVELEKKILTTLKSSKPLLNK